MPTLAADVLLLTATPVKAKLRCRRLQRPHNTQASPQSLDGRIILTLAQ